MTGATRPIKIVTRAEVFGWIPRLALPVVRAAGRVVLIVQAVVLAWNVSTLVITMDVALLVRRMDRCFLKSHRHGYFLA